MRQNCLQLSHPPCSFEGSRDEQPPRFKPGVFAKVPAAAVSARRICQPGNISRPHLSPIDSKKRSLKSSKPTSRNKPLCRHEGPRSTKAARAFLDPESLTRAVRFIPIGFESKLGTESPLLLRAIFEKPIPTLQGYLHPCSALTAQTFGILSPA